MAEGGASDSLSVKEVMNEISKEVTDYHSLGIQLDITPAQLEIFEKDCPSNNHKFGVKVIDYWIKNGKDPSLESLAEAVEKTDKHKKLAKRLKEKAEARKKAREETVSAQAEPMVVHDGTAKEEVEFLSRDDTSTNSTDEISESVLQKLESLLCDVNTSSLDEDDIFDVHKALLPVTSRWREIGLGLRLKSRLLTDVGKAYFGDPSTCLSMTISYWLEGEYNTERFGKPTWKKVVEVVGDPAAGNDPSLACQIAREHLVQKREPSDIKSNPEVQSMEMVKSLSAQLKSKLEFFAQIQSNRENMEESKLTLIKGVMQDFIQACLHGRASTRILKIELRELYSKDMMISSDVYQWSLELVDAVAETIPQESQEESATDEDAKPLYCKETLYYASLCCCAVSSCTAATYKKFFSEDFPYHSLEEVSFSISADKDEVDRYLIARQGKTLYIAFQSEPYLKDWHDKFESFQQGIEVQAARIPERFFINQLHDGYSIVFTGFSFGGLLALSVAASLWKSPLLSVDILQSKVACITFGHPLISLPIVDQVVCNSPEFETTVHSVFLSEDTVPVIMRLLDPKCDEYCTDITTDNPLISLLPSRKTFQGPFTSMLLFQLSTLQEQEHEKIADKERSREALSKAKSVLSDSLPVIMRSSGGAIPSAVGAIYLLQPQVPHESWKSLTREQQSVELGYKKISSTEYFNLGMFMKHNIHDYHQRLFRHYLDQTPKYSLPPLQSNPPPEIVNTLPKALGVAFHRHGKELAVIVTGQNLWFCNQVRVSGHTESINPDKISQKSIQFNCSIDEEHILSPDSDKVKLALSSHFYRPMRNHVPVTSKVYLFTHRQEQLAKLTPSELIEVAYLSTLLEQHPYKEIARFSSRFSVLKQFLEEVVSVVPIESFIHTTATGDMQCLNVLLTSDLCLPPSLELSTGLFKLFVVLFYDISLDNYGCISAQDVSDMVAGHPENKIFLKQVHKESLRKAAEAKLNSTTVSRDSVYVQQLFHQRNPYSRIVSICSVMSDEELKTMTQMNPNLLRHIALKFVQVQYANPTEAINGLSLQCLYSVSSLSSSTTAPYSLPSPLDILKNGRKKLHWLAEQSVTINDSVVISSTAIEENKKLSALFNSKMLDIVNTIRQGELKRCTSLLGAFMENRMRIPLVKSSIDTARVINVLMSSAAVGVWALFSLGVGDIQAIIDSIPSRSMLVEVTNYIKGIFKHKTLSADDNYAGKLQFMVQGLKETVSCNSHYISYSLERQLIELCKKLCIDRSTPLETLLDKWDDIFKGNVLSLVMKTHRPLIARWLKWALMIHHLREELARYTAVGVVGLVNSGKSVLVHNLFKIEIPVGTTEVKRTTIPFLYNLDGIVDGLDVIDFPGVDDRDETIPDLAELLLSLAQIVVFIVDYRKVHTESAKKWLEALEERAGPLLVCLTFADKLYAEHMRQCKHPPADVIRQKVARELVMVEEKLGFSPSRTVKYVSFCQDQDSVLNCPEGRECLRAAGIGDPSDVGDWLVEVFRKELDQGDLGDRLHEFVHKGDK